MGGKVSVTYPGGDPLINNLAFPQMEELMDSEQVYFGITASMTLYKSVMIKNFNFYESKIFN